MPNRPPRMAASASSGTFPPPPAGDRVGSNPFAPQGRNWPDSTEHTWESEIYIDVCKHYAEFSATALRGILKNGTSQVNAVVGLVHDARQLRKIACGRYSNPVILSNPLSTCTPISMAM